MDTQGFPHAVAVTTAEVTDRKDALQALGRCMAGLDKVQSVLCDSGRAGEPFALGVRQALGDEMTVQFAVRSLGLLAFVAQGNRKHALGQCHHRARQPAFLRSEAEGSGVPKSACADSLVAMEHRYTGLNCTPKKGTIPCPRF